MAEKKKPPRDSLDPIRNFTLTLEERVRALGIGAPAWSRRKRAIEDFDDDAHDALVKVGHARLAQGASLDEVRRALVAKAERLDVEGVNRLVDDHNRWYPAEANLPMDLRTGAYLVLGVPFRAEPHRTRPDLVRRALDALTLADAGEVG